MPSEERWIELADGEEFAGYRVERTLGRGGMGVLYLAIESGLERRVALKLIAPEAAADEVFTRRFAEESRVAASIEHPNVVPIYAAGEERGVPFIAMRYVAGSDLGKRLARDGRLEPPVAGALIAQVGNGLDAIHAAGLVHRDVKPANVLLSETGAEDHAYITDFGVARNVSTESGLTQTGRFVGTLDYVAPEQISGGKIDARVDVYALGCLLYKLLTGEVPFPRDGEAARLYAHLNDPPPAPSLHATAVPMALDDVVIRAMSKQPDDRYPSAGDLGRAAVAALSGAAPELPERTVATGAAATGTAKTIAPAGSATPDVPTRAASAETAETHKLGADEVEVMEGSVRRHWLAAAAAGLAGVAAVAIAVLVLGGGGGDGDPAAGGSEATARSQDQAKAGDGRQDSTEGKTETLTRPELIAKADAICKESKDRYLEVYDRESEFSTDILYAEALARMARARVRKLRALTPSPGLAGLYDEYVKAQTRVYKTDRQALTAAKAEDAIGVEEARSERDSEDELRERLARKIGFEVCSTQQS